MGRVEIIEAGGGGGAGPALTVPGETRVVDPEAASRLRYFAQRAAGELRFDKVTAGTVLLDLAVRLLRTNSPPVHVGHVREALERALVLHGGG